MFRLSRLVRCANVPKPTPEAAEAAAAAAAAATSSSAAAASSSSSTATGAAAAKKPELDAAAKQRLKVAEAMGEEALTENVEILKRLGTRALRAFAVGALGIAAFFVVLKRKRREEEALKAKEGAEAADAAAAGSSPQAADEDPTARYLREMGGQGWDVEEGEKAARAVQTGGKAKK